MRVLQVIAMMLVALQGVGVGQAQIERFPIVDPYIDTHVELAGFPTTGSQLEAARHDVANAITSEINDVVEAIGELEATSVVGREYVEAIDTAVEGSTPLTSAQQAMQQRPRTTSNPFSDDRAAVPEYDGIDSEIVRQINDAVRDIFRSEDGSELPVYQPPASDESQPRLNDLMGRYAREIAALRGQLLLEEIEARRLADAVADGASAALDDANPAHRDLVKRVIRRYVQIMTASQDLPISGYWRVTPFEFSRTGACEVYTGDNGGDAPITTEHDPGEPLCGHDGEPPFLTWRSAEYPYVPGTASIYSAAPAVQIQIARDSNGATLRSVRTTHSVEYEVVAPDRIVVRESFHEEGGCSLSAEYTLELVQQDETVCNITDLTPDTDEETDPSVPPGESRTMRVGSPFYLDEESCNEQNRPPQFSDVTLTAAHDGSLRLDYDGGGYTLYGDNWGYYEFNIGTGGTARQMIGLNLYDGGREGNLTWSASSSADAPQCYVSLPLTSSDGTANGEAPQPDDLTSDTLDTPVGDDEAFGALIPGTYAATWYDTSSMCPEALRPQAPQFETVTVSTADNGSALLQSDAHQFEIARMAAGTYMSTSPGDSHDITLGLTTTEPGAMNFTWMLMTPDGELCMVMADLLKID